MTQAIAEPKTDVPKTESAYKQLNPVFHVQNHEELSDLEARVHKLEEHVHMVPGKITEQIKVSWPISVAVTKHSNGIKLTPIYGNHFDNIMPFNVKDNPAHIQHISVDEDYAMICIGEHNYQIYFHEKKK